MRILALLNEYITELQINKSINPSLNKLIGENTKTAISTIVDENGNGTFTNIKDAVESGATLITVKDGNYTIDEDLILDGQYILGESQEGVQITLQNATIKFKEISDISGGGTAQFNEDDRTVDGDNSAFDNLNDDIDNKFLYTDGSIMEINYIESNVLMELKSLIQGNTTNPVGDTVIQEDQVSFASLATTGGIENLTINHEITKVSPAIIINGHQNTIKNVRFYNESQLSIFIVVSINNTQIATKTLIQDNWFEGGANPIKVNRAYHTTIKGNYFSIFSEIAIELFSQSKFTEIKQNVISSGKYGISGNTKDCNILENTFSYTRYNAIKLNYGTFTDESTGIICLDNQFFDCNSSESYTTNGTATMRGENNIIAQSNFSNCTAEIVVNGAENIISDVSVGTSSSSSTIIIPGGENNIIANIMSELYGINYSEGSNNILDGFVSANNSMTIEPGEIGSNSIMINCSFYIDEYYIKDDNIVINCFLYANSLLTPKNNCILVDNFVYDGYITGIGGIGHIIAFNINESANSAIATSENSVVKANYVQGVNPPATDSEINNIMINNYF